MKIEIERKLLLLSENVQAIAKDKSLKWYEGHNLTALLYAQENKSIDCQAVRDCLGLIKANTKGLSALRGNVSMALAALLSLSDAPETLFGKVVTVYDMLKAVKLSRSDYLVMAAYLIASRAAASDFQRVVDRTRAFYDGMKEDHVFLTGEDDHIFAAMLGLSDLDETTGVVRIEQLYQRFKGEFGGKNSVQGLAQVLALGDEQAAQRVIPLRDAAKARNVRMDKSLVIPMLGLLALLPVRTDAVASELAEASDFLRQQKGFGVLSADNKERVALAAAVVADEYAAEGAGGVVAATLSSSILSILIANQIMMMMIMMSTVTVVAASG
ncbi:MAG: DUF4003 domain-containing protein [Propionibacteriaceae bacterium]|jgi:hypothetical protein|nr:DUF4003 domain-containing protein [Propionibacteriaceae bacterium]